MYVKVDKEKILAICANSDYLNNIQEIFNLECFELAKVIDKNASNNYSSLKQEYFKDDEKQAGVYIFLNSCKEPVYVGLSGVKEKNVQSNLFQRITNQLTKSSHLLKNIVDVENILNKNLKLEQDKAHILTYAPYLLVYSCDKDIEKAQALELILLSTLQLKYNR